jgi:hypothetical protein
MLIKRKKRISEMNMGKQLSEAVYWFKVASMKDSRLGKFPSLGKNLPKP